MKRSTCTLDHLIDQVNITESERETAKAQVQRAEAVVDAVEAIFSGINGLGRLLTFRKNRSVHQH